MKVEKQDNKPSSEPMHTFTAKPLPYALIPDRVTLDDKGITLISRHLLSAQSDFLFYKDINKIELDKGVFFCDITIKARWLKVITIKNFTKEDAEKVKAIILEHRKF